jgi:spore coat protein CotF
MKRLLQNQWNQYKQSAVQSEYPVLIWMVQNAYYHSIQMVKQLQDLVLAFEL